MLSSRRNSAFSRRSSNGAALIVVLVILAAITVVGVSNMQSATLEMRMITSAIDRNEAFALAEAGLVNAELALESRVNGLDDLYTDTCSSANGPCFDATCSDGYCFEGEFAGDEAPYLCEVLSADSAVERKIFWKDESLWSDNAIALDVGAGGGDEVELKYIVEFLCFVDNSGNFGPAAPSDGDPFFRITVFLEGDGGRAPVMLQSNYVVKI